MTEKICTTAMPRRGRPPAICPDERRALILDATERILARKGLRGATMAAIACEARMSKRTLYEVFGDREALFADCVRRLRSSFLRPLDEVERRLPLPERLRILLRPGGKVLATPSALLRAVIAEAPSHPDLAHSFLREGPRAIRAAIAEELDRAVASDEVQITDTDEAARLLCGLVFENPIEHLVDPGGCTRCEAEIDARMAQGIRVFLGGIEAAQI
jgi:TetR/AcrR family transcriptional regulator, mexJK operon transcriptional repressor